MSGKVRLFDMNGTIRNDLDAVLSAMNDVLRHYGIPALTVGKYRKSATPDYWTIYRGLGVPDSERPSVDRLFAQFFKGYEHDVRAFPDAADVIKRLKEKGHAIGIVSNLTRKRLSGHVRDYGLGKFVDIVVSREDADELKPSPKPLLLAFSRLGVPPENGAYVGDQIWDVQSARSAGTSPIAISRAGSYHSRRMLESAEPDRIINKLPSLLYFNSG
ncbi:MAG: HAD-IA family hydrolase [Candidatus Aenigmarchaeota archaeon]|nr:HAD-IA family hydrolase [Candidatus Aenigmarchaeota archaeon]